MPLRFEERSLNFFFFWWSPPPPSSSPPPSASPLTKVPAPRISGSSPRGRPGTPSGTFYTDDEDENDDDHHYTGDNLLIRDEIRLWWKWFLPQSWVPLLCSIWCGVSWNFYQKMTGSLVIYIVGSTKRPMRLGQLTKSYSCPVFHDLSMFEIQPWVKSSSCHCQTLVVVISPSSGKSHFRENQ